ncbi:hypothetical protein PIB30_092716 [Stylosanthes scabra]|uniref:Uncharacterized protein n=1 Tax=Stylosanthes scabra TaxID=79078 RepID=A0ABU6UTT6_9FABA|nr:hypothetical protein [Stylosanthes scabra]
MDETYVDATDVAECSTSSKSLRIGNMDVISSGDEIMLMEHIGRIKKLLMIIIGGVVIGLILSFVSFLR